MFAPNPHRPLGQTLLLGTVVIGTAALGAVVLWAATGWLWLVVHQGLH
jgi:multisubunit Na+/H+ antiporter MnhC subunit